MGSKAQPRVEKLSRWDIDSHLVRRLSSYFKGRLVPGFDQDLRSPLFAGMDDDEILAAWDAYPKPPGVELVKRLSEMESAQRAKFGPRSIARPWDARREDAYAYFDTRESTSVGQDWLQWIADGCEDFNSPQVPAFLGLRGRDQRLRPSDPNETVGRMRLNTASGLPRMSKKGDVVDETLASLEEELDAVYPAVLYTRTQEGGKDRIVWGVPFADVIREQRYYQVILPLLLKLPWRAALRGPDEVDLAVTRLFNCSRSGVKLSIDFSSYDSSLDPLTLFHIILFMLGGYFQTRYFDECDEIARRMVSIGLACPDGVLTGPHGMPSGSTFTNEGDSWFQALAYAYAVHQGVVASPLTDAYQIQGDDGLYNLDSTSDCDKLMEWFGAMGLEVNHDKSDVAEDHALFLQRLYHPAYHGSGVLHGVYSTTRALNRVVHLERWPSDDDDEAGELGGADYFALRTIGILENAKYHPWFEALVNFIADNDRDGLAFSIDGAKTYSRRYGRFRANVSSQDWHGEAPHGRGTIETPGALHKFAVMQVLRSRNA